MGDMSRYLGARGMFDKLLEVFCRPPMIIFLFFMISTWYLVNIATQSLLHSCSMEIRDPDLRSLNICSACASWESLVERRIVVRFEGSMLAPFATCTEGHVDSSLMYVLYCLAEGTN